MSYYLTPTKLTTRKNTKTTTQNKAQDWICVICNNLNFSFRKKCNRCKTQTRYQNQNHVISAYSQYYYQSGYGKDGKYEGEVRDTRDARDGKDLDMVKSPLSDSTNLYTPQCKNQGKLVIRQKNKDKQKLNQLFPSINYTTNICTNNQCINIPNINLNHSTNPITHLDLSKLAKQYCPKDIQTALENSSSSSKKQHFTNQYWQFINVRDFDQICKIQQSNQKQFRNCYNNSGHQQQQQEQQQEQDTQGRNQSERMEAQLERMFNKILLQDSRQKYRQIQRQG